MCHAGSQDMHLVGSQDVALLRAKTCAWLGVKTRALMRAKICALLRAKTWEASGSIWEASGTHPGSIWEAPGGVDLWLPENPGGGMADNSAAPPRQSGVTNFGRSWELGKNRHNPFRQSLFGGICPSLLSQQDARRTATMQSLGKPPTKLGSSLLSPYDGHYAILGQTSYKDFSLVFACPSLSTSCQFTAGILKKQPSR